MKKQILTGFIVGLICTGVGIVLCTFIVSLLKGMSFNDTFNFYTHSGNLWMLISLGALPNLAAFFGFLRLNSEYKARGVLMATFAAAITAYLIYFL